MDIFDKLAELEVPPPPANFDTEVHERVNKSLVALHFADLLLRGLPWAMLHFGKAVVALIVTTLTGKDYDDRNSPGGKKTL
jgi:hypothetical protein